MAYTVVNFKTKKALKEAVAKWKEYQVVSGHDNINAPAVRCFQPGLGPDLSNYTGKVCLEGPHSPQPHRWYAQAEMVNGVVVKVY